MIKWAAGAQISQVSSLRHSLHYHTEQTHACVESQIPATDISRGTEERWLHPTYIHPTPACLLPTNYTHKHTQSHYRWIHIITVTVQGELQAYYRIIQFQLAVLLLPNLLSICLDFKGRKKTLYKRKSYKWPPGDWERNLSQGFCTGLDENIICVMGCENSPSTKTLETNLRLLELVQMPRARKQLYWISFKCLMQWEIYTYSMCIILVV